MSKSENQKSMLLSWRRVLVAACHLGIVTISLVISFLLRFDLFVPQQMEPELYRGLEIALIAKMSIFWMGRLYEGWWRFVGVMDLVRVFCANVGASLAFSIITYFMIGPTFPRSVYFIDFLLCFLLTGGARFIVRFYNEAVADIARHGRKRVLIYGAGAAGMTLLAEIRTNPSMGYEVAGFLDDNREKHNAIFKGVSVLGTGYDAARIVDWHKTHGSAIDEIVIAMPSASGRQMGEALANCRATGLPCKTIPGIGEILTGRILSSQIRNISVTDLLGREPVRLEENRIHEKIAGRSVMVTGAGGSIGSELCRQIAVYGPHRLVAFDQAESDLFRIDSELSRKFPNLDIVPIVGDIRSLHRVTDVIREYSIDSVFHAAAYKHVPMMERHVLEAVQNNIIGTWNVVRASSRAGVSDFLLISTDKAVNPTNIMGVTKRVAELIATAIPANSAQRTKFVSVRFGNVLGSNGSVVPLFQTQIAEGGPVTVTHPDVRRYFMTIREAVQLVLQASTMGRGSEVFVLDMGEPIRILDLARNMIRLSGLRPDTDIEIRFTGLRPGEKLHEELITASEVASTSHDKVKVFQGPRRSFIELEAWIHDLERLIGLQDELGIVDHLTKLVPEYQPAGRLASRRTLSAHAQV